MLRFGTPLLLAAVVAPSMANAAETAASIARSSVQAAIVKTVESDRTTYGGRDPLPAVLIGVAVTALLLALYVVTVLHTTSDKRLQQIGK